MAEENAVETLQRYRRDRRALLNFMLSGSLIKKVAMPPGAVSLDDIDLDQASVDYVRNCVKKGEMLELSEAIRDYHDSTLFPRTSVRGMTMKELKYSNPMFRFGFSLRNVCEMVLEVAGASKKNRPTSGTLSNQSIDIMKQKLVNNLARSDLHEATVLYYVKATSVIEMNMMSIIVNQK